MADKHYIEAEQDLDRPPDYLWVRCTECDGKGTDIWGKDYCPVCRGEEGWYKEDE